VFDVLISSLCCALLAAGTAFAQPATPAATATLSGVVLDESGAALDEVEVIATNTAIGLQRTATTGKQGAFTIPLLPPGPYLVTAQREGFAAAQVQELMLGATGVTPIRIQLRIASPSESVVVTAQKRGAERVQDVPVPVAVIDTEQLASNRQVLATSTTRSATSTASTARRRAAGCSPRCGGRPRRRRCA
jgi:hypothetical protein